MKILALTAGASGMYCGTCLRDNALAAELSRQGHDVVLLPLYTPTRTDEENVSHPRIFFNGVSIYLQQNWPLLRRLPAFFDRFLDSAWLLRLATARSVPVDPKLLGELTVAMLQGRDGALRREFDKLTKWLSGQPAPDVVDIPYSLLIALARPLKELLRCPVVCTLQGEDLFLSGLIEPYRSQSLSLIAAGGRHVDVFIASSEYYADFMARYLSIPAGKIRVVPLGINLQGHAPVRSDHGAFRVGYLARIAPEKGLHLLVDAWHRLRKDKDLGPGRLEVAGYLPPANRDYLRQAEQTLRENGLAEEFRYHGEVDRPAKIRFLQSLDVLSVPSTFDEPKGLFVFEALANGVPVVEPRRGAYPEILERTGGGLLVEPDSAAALAEALRTMWLDAGLRRRLGDQGCAAVREHHSIERMAGATAAVYRSLGGAAQA
ncbi:MAG: glycosyltransferase family 4 protein [Acidobacteriota bacterium]